MADNAPPFIMVIEDEWSIQKLLQLNLQQAGYSVIVCDDTDQAWDHLLEMLPKVIILDWMLPGQSGLEFLRELRQNARARDVPVMMLTARTHEVDRIKGLDVGADDYLGKPFSIDELLARIKALLRRSATRQIESETLSIGDVTLDIQECLVTRDGKPLHLGPTEFRLLEHFMRHPGRVYSREQLLDSVWGTQVYVEERTVDVHIRRLRKSLCADGGSDPIRTVRSMGYALQKQ